MRKIGWLFVAVVIMTTLEAKEKKDPVVMKVVDKEILLSEFLYMAKKDNQVDLKDKKSVENYVELYKNYKLKVADAEAMSIHQAPKFEKELNSFKRMLQESFISDKAGEDSAVYVIYERTKSLPVFKQILFLFKKPELVTNDTVPVYNRAMEAYNRIKNGESIEAVAQSLTSDGNDSTRYAEVPYLFPFQVVKELEDKLYSMEAGELSMPIRSMGGFHVVWKEGMIPNPGKVRVAHILTRFPAPNPTEEEIEATRQKSDAIYQQVISGADFATLAKENSGDTLSAVNGGLLDFFGLGQMVEPFEKAAFALENIGDISKPVQTRFGFHVLKLVEQQQEVPFEYLESSIHEAMKGTERNFDLYRSFVEKMKVRHQYIPYPEAYAELEELADVYFPTSESFIERAMQMEKPLFRLDTLDFPQNLFVEYLYRSRASAKTYSKDFMKEIFNLYLHDILTEMERESLEQDYPEYNSLVNEYYDGILLFEISNKRVWLHPVEEQQELEAEWLKELNEKYPVSINWKVIKKIKKYLN